MILSSDQILAELQEIYPGFEWEFPTNPYWEDLPDELFKEAIKECSLVGEFETIPGIWECENYAWEWKARFHKLQYKWYKSGKYKPKCRNWTQFSTGETTDFIGDETKHTKIIIRLESGFVLFEPQTDEVSRDYQSFIPFLGTE